MTCPHALDLIDATGLVDISPAQLDAVRAHARECAACAKALRMAEAIALDLGAIDQPAPPPELAAGILAQIARIEPSDETPARAADRVVGATSLVTLVAGLVILLASAWLGRSGSSLHFIGAGGDIPTTAAAAEVLMAGLLLYVAGLFAPVRRALRR